MNEVMWSLVISYFTIYAVNWGLTSWIPTYLSDVRQLDLMSIGWLQTIPGVIMIISMFLSGYIDEESKSIAYASMSNEQKVQLGDKKLSHLVYPLAPEAVWYVSTDVGDVSWVTPTVQCMISSFVLGTPLHTWQVVSVGKTSIAHKGMLYAAEVMAKTAIHCMENPDVIQRAKEELVERLNGKQYVSLIPETT